MMDPADLELFERSLRQATERHTGQALDGALEEVGWRDALSVDPRLAVSLLFELQGAANAASSALDHVMATALGIDDDPTRSFVLPPLDSWDPPAGIAGDHVRVRGLGAFALPSRQNVLVVAATDDGRAHAAISVQTADLTLRPIGGIDPSLDLVEVSAEAAGSGPPTDLEPTQWTAAVDLARLALAHELVGASRTMLELARQHALERIQYGRPIATFQAVRHRLADALLAIETGVAVLTGAWDERSPEIASMAKSLAGKSARTVARHCQQVLAGIGFTTEHPFHRYLRRTLVLDQLFGSARSLTKELGRELLESRRLPSLLPL